FGRPFFVSLSGWQLRLLGEAGESVHLVRERHGVDEEALEVRLQCSFDLLDPGDLMLDLPSMVPIEQRHQCSGSSGISHRLYIRQVAVGDKAEDRGTVRSDERDERARKAE